METLKFGLMLTIIPFTAIFMVVAIWWALVDISVRKLKGAERAMWTLLVILLPPIGSIIYNYSFRQRHSAC
jgi:uncharacterized membrane protein YhaH (DUF805 family)